MAEIEIHVEDNGQVSPRSATVSPGDKIVWKPRTVGNKIDIFFDDKVPFNVFLEPKWLNKQETNEDKIDGKIKGHRKGTRTEYPYNTLRSIGGTTSGPELIVDGGRGVHKTTSKKAKTATTSKTKKSKVRKTKQLARGTKTRKGTAKKGRARKGAARTAAKSRASRKR